MSKNSSKKFKDFLPLFVFIILFIAISYVVQTNLEFFETVISNSMYGYFIYGLLIFLATVFAPITMIPLMPSMSLVFGWVLNGFICWISWSLGFVTAFYIARKYGVKIVSKFVSLKEINKYENLVPEKQVFLSVLFLKMALPVDVLSYLLGLFSKISYRNHAIASFIGILPFSFILAYVGTIPFYYQVTGAFLVLVMMIIVLFYLSKKDK